MFINKTFSDTTLGTFIPVFRTRLKDYQKYLQEVNEKQNIRIKMFYILSYLRLYR